MTDFQGDGELTQAAGLVLVNGYLHLLFERLDVQIEEDKIRDVDLPLALSALDLLAPVSKRFDPLKAVLLGVSYVQLEAVSAHELSDHHREIVGGMLEALIERLPQLSGTSIQGFQATFMDRDGRVMVGAESVVLQVERQSFDVLMDNFPLSFDTFQLPWMHTVLHVEW